MEARALAVILAAGEAVRMGAAKPAMPFGNKTLVGAVIDTAKAAGMDPVVVVTGFHRESVVAAVGDSARIAHNPDAASGNMSSLLVGIDAVGGVDAVAVLLADMPRVRAEVVNDLTRGLRESGRMVAWTQYSDGRGHPIALTTRGISAIRGLDGSKALWPFFDALKPKAVFEMAVEGARPADINTPADYKNAT